MGRLSWFEEEIEHRTGFTLVDPQECYKNVRKAWRCNRRELARLRVLCAWRELYAREKDLPRGHVVKDDQLVELVLQRSVDRDAVGRTLEPSAARRHGKELLALIEQADALGEDALPEPLAQPFTSSETKMLKELKAIGAERARALDMAEELLSRRRDLESCLRNLRTHGGLPENFQGWRRALVGDLFEAKLLGVARPMKHVIVYKSTRIDQMYLFVDRDEGLERVPGALLTRFGKPIEAMRLELTPQRRLSRSDAPAVLDAIANQGFYLQLPPAIGTMDFQT